MRRRSFLIGSGVLLAVIGIGAWVGRTTYQTARIGTAYVAKQTCSCRFVAHRTEASCRTDYTADDIRSLSVGVAPNSVTVSALGDWISAKAEFEEGFGCHVVN